MSGEKVWINGRLVERDEARVSAFDAGLLHGVGLFETMHATPSGVFRLDDHLARLSRSATDLGLTQTLNTSSLAEAVRDAVAGSDVVGSGARARVRLTLTGGDLNLLERDAASQTTPTILISVTPATRYPEEMFSRGIGLLVAGVKANPLNAHEGHKSLAYWWRLRALQEAAQKRMGEALILQVTNHVCGGAVSNVFAVRDGALITPMARGEEESGAMPSPVLPGVTRRVVIELAQRVGVGCDQRLMDISDILDADEVFLTNSSWGVLPVVGVEATPIGDGKPGALTSRLRDMWLAESA